MASFDIDIPKNKTKTIDIDYPSISVSAINKLNANITASVNYNSANVTYADETQKPIKYKAKTTNNITIYGKTLHNIPGLNHSGELIIKNIGSSESDILYIVFLLEYEYITVELNDIDRIISSSTNASNELNLKAILKEQTTGKGDFIFYETTLNDKTTPCKVAVFTQLLSISYNNQIPSDTSTGTPFVINTNTYDVIPMLEVDEGEWMECAYSTDHPENITTYNVSMKDEILGEKNVLDIFKTISLFIVFLLVCVVGYIFVPVLYATLVNIILKYAQTSDKKNYVRKINVGLSAIFIITFSILLYIGFSNSDNNFKLYGIIIGIIFTISYIIIQTKIITNDNFLQLD